MRRVLTVAKVEIHRLSHQHLGAERGADTGRRVSVSRRRFDDFRGRPDPTVGCLSGNQADGAGPSFRTTLPCVLVVDVLRSGISSSAACGGKGMYFKSLLSTAVLTGMVAVFPVFSASASASPSPTISDFSPKQGPVGTTVTISGTNLANATSVTFGKTAATVTVDHVHQGRRAGPDRCDNEPSSRSRQPRDVRQLAAKFVVTAPLGGVVSLVERRRRFLRSPDLERGRLLGVRP